jgi:hypothetical protein
MDCNIWKIQDNQDINIKKFILDLEVRCLERSLEFISLLLVQVNEVR